MFCPEPCWAGCRAAVWFDSVLFHLPCLLLIIKATLFTYADCISKATSMYGYYHEKYSSAMLHDTSMVGYKASLPSLETVRAWREREERGLEIIRVKSDPLSSVQSAALFSHCPLLISIAIWMVSPSPMLRNPLQLPRCEH